MKRIYWSIVLLVFVSCNDNTTTEQTEDDPGQKENTVEETKTPTFKEVFPEFYNYLIKQIPGFKDSLDGGSVMLTDTLAPNPITKENIETDLPYFIFNSDSSFAIDMATNNYVLIKRNGKIQLEDGGPDMEIALLNFKDSTRRRIYFFGTSGAVLDAKWENDSTVVFATVEETENKKDELSIWRYHVSSGAYEKYGSQPLDRIDFGSYTKDMLNRKASKTTPAF